MNLLSDIKILTEKVHCIKNLHSSEDLIDAVNSSVLEVVTDADRHLTESNDSVETESKKENWKKISKKIKAKATQQLQQFPKKFS